MPGRGENLQMDVAQRQPLPVVQVLDRKGNVRACAVSDDRAGPSGKLHMPADEIGVYVCLYHALDGETPGCSFLEVHADVAPWIDHHRTTGGFIAHQVGRV